MRPTSLRGVAYRTCFERRNHGCWNARDGYVFGTVADRQAHDLGAIRDRDDREVVAAAVGDQADVTVPGGLRPAGAITHRYRGDQRQVFGADQRGVVRGAAREAQRAAIIRERKTMMRCLEIPIGRRDARLHRQLEAPDYGPTRDVVGYHAVLIRPLRIDPFLVGAELPGSEGGVELYAVTNVQSFHVSDRQLERMTRRLRQRRRIGGARQGAQCTEAGVVELLPVSRDLHVVRIHAGHEMTRDLARGSRD